MAKIVVIGGGLAGLSTAYYLASYGVDDVIVVEREKKIGAHASGNNAGMIRQTVSDPMMAGLAAEGRKALSGLRGSAWKKLEFQTNGSLLLESQGSSESGSILEAARKNRIACKQIPKETAFQKVRALRSACFDRAIFCPTDALVDVGGLLEGFQKELKRLGVRVFLGHPLRFARKSNDRFIVRAGNSEFIADKIVNAAGAWAGSVAKIAGASKLPLAPYLRHLYESKGGPESSQWPFVWHLDRGLYFRPVPRGILASPCDKTFFRAEKPFDPKMRKHADQAARESLRLKFKSFNVSLKSTKFRSRRVGLRTMAPDGRFVLGEDPKLKNFFWVAGLGGHGVTTSLSVGNLAARLVLGMKVDSKIARWASPKRFDGTHE